VTALCCANCVKGQSSETLSSGKGYCEFALLPWQIICRVHQCHCKFLQIRCSKCCTNGRQWFSSQIHKSVTAKTKSAFTTHFFDFYKARLCWISDRNCTNQPMIPKHWFSSKSKSDYTEKMRRKFLTYHLKGCCKMPSLFHKEFPCSDEIAFTLKSGFL